MDCNCCPGPWSRPVLWDMRELRGCRRLGPARNVRVNYRLPGALNSAVECHLHTVEVAGSNPAAPTNKPHKISYLMSWLGLAISPVRHSYVMDIAHAVRDPLGRT